MYMQACTYTEKLDTPAGTVAVLVVSLGSSFVLPLLWFKIRKNNVKLAHTAITLYVSISSQGF